MTPALLQSRLQSAPPILIHVLPAEIFAAKHIAGSHNACVYEMTFLDQVSAIAPDKASAIVVYGAGEGSLDASTAAAKLSAAGYSGVEVLEEGLAGWEEAGLPLDGTRELPQAPLLEGTFIIDTSESGIRWTGRNLFNRHHGTLRLAGGQIEIRNGALVAARFMIDMQTIACEDLTDPQWNAMLLRHLRDADFFDVANHPTAEFIATSASQIPDGSEGTPNFLLKGNITIRGITQPLELPVVIACSDEKRITGQAQFEFDRTLFGSHYGSGKLFRFLGKHLVNDHIHLHVKLHADLAN